MSISFGKIQRTIYNAIIYFTSCYLLCCGIIILVILQDAIDMKEAVIFPASYDRWCRHVLWDVMHSRTMTQKLANILLHASLIFQNHINEIFVVFVTFSLLPVQGLLLSLLPSWLVDTFDAVKLKVPSAFEEDVPHLEEDPAFTQLCRNHIIMVDGKELKSTVKDTSPLREPTIPLTESHSAMTSVDPAKQTTTESRVNHFVFDSVFGVVDKEIRDRWRRQERDCRIALEAVSARRRQSLMPPVRYAGFQSQVPPPIPATAGSNAPSTGSAGEPTAADDLPKSPQLQTTEKEPVTSAPPASSCVPSESQQTNFVEPRASPGAKQVIKVRRHKK